MYYIDMKLEDGTLADAPGLSVFNSEGFKLSISHRRSLIAAYAARGPRDGKNIVFAGHGRVLGAAYGMSDWSEAIRSATEDFVDLYTAHKWLMPRKGVVALMRPFPERRLDELPKWGVDTIFAPDWIRNDVKINQQMWIDCWLHADWDFGVHAPRGFILRHFHAKSLG